MIPLGVCTSEAKNCVVIGGAELWPYFDPKRNVIIVDARTSRRINELSGVVESVDFIILNKDYAGYGWENRFSGRYPHIKLRTIAEVGNPGSGRDFVKIIKPEVLK